MHIRVGTVGGMPLHIDVAKAKDLGRRGHVPDVGALRDACLFTLQPIISMTLGHHFRSFVRPSVKSEVLIL